MEKRGEKGIKAGEELYAAMGQAMAAYDRRLREGPGTALQTERWEWKESKSSAVDLITAMAGAGSIHINGVPATARQLRTGFERRFRMELKDFDNLLYATDTRKVDETPYFTKLVNAWKGRKGRLGK
jgi:hypothetical protein